MRRKGKEAEKTKKGKNNNKEWKKDAILVLVGES